MEDTITPTKINADREKRVMTIEWNDGKSCGYGFGALRDACPCATCRGDSPDEGQEDPFALPLIDVRAKMLRNLELVGNYALTIEWEDGHHYGIYNWEYLRSLCEE